MDKINWINKDNAKEALSMEDIFSTIEKITGLEVSVYPSFQDAYNFRKLPIIYQNHMSDFCRVVKANKAGNGCAGHDSVKMTKKAKEIGKPFVNICHAGIAEVILPVFGVTNFHIATIFIGQAVTEEVKKNGFREVMNRVKNLGIDQPKLKKAFENIPEYSCKDLLNFGRLVDMAVKAMGDDGVETFEQEMLLAANPAIRHALDIIDKGNNFLNVKESEIARKVFLNPAYFSRLFKKIMKRNFSKYMNEKKIIFASNLLHQTDLSIMDISSACGYSKQSYFTRVFRTATGMTPTQYRSNTAMENLKISNEKSKQYMIKNENKHRKKIYFEEN